MGSPPAERAAKAKGLWVLASVCMSLHLPSVQGPGDILEKLSSGEGGRITNRVQVFLTWRVLFLMVTSVSQKSEGFGTVLGIVKELRQ